MPSETLSYLIAQSGILALPIWALLLAITWSLIWKGIALWKSARKNHKIWFILLLIINTLGILEILYIFLFSEIKLQEQKSRKKKKH